MHPAFDTFVKTFDVIDKLVASGKAIALCKKELRRCREVSSYRNWPRTDMRLKSTDTSNERMSVSTQDKQQFRDEHMVKLETKLKNFETIMHIHRRCSAMFGK